MHVKQPQSPVYSDNFGRKRSTVKTNKSSKSLIHKNDSSVSFKPHSSKKRKRLSASRSQSRKRVIRVGAGLKVKTDKNKFNKTQRFDSSSTPKPKSKAPVMMAFG